MKQKSKNFIINLGIYPFDIMVSLGETDEVLEKKLKQSGIDPTDGYFKFRNKAIGRFVMFPGNQSLIRLMAIPRTPVEFGTLQHEIFHAVTFILDRAGIKLKLSSSDEAYSYLTAYITEQIYKKL